MHVRLMARIARWARELDDEDARRNLSLKTALISPGIALKGTAPVKRRRVYPKKR
jgi:hypothetical protein